MNLPSRRNDSIEARYPMRLLPRDDNHGNRFPPPHQDYSHDKHRHAPRPDPPAYMPVRSPKPSAAPKPRAGSWPTEMATKPAVKLALGTNKENVILTSPIQSRIESVRGLGRVSRKEMGRGKENGSSASTNCFILPKPYHPQQPPVVKARVKTSNRQILPRGNRPVKRGVVKSNGARPPKKLFLHRARTEGSHKRKLPLRDRRPHY